MWFGRDAFGRRSLLVHWSNSEDSRFLLSSVSPISTVKQSSGIYSWGELSLSCPWILFLYMVDKIINVITTSEFHWWRVNLKWIFCYSFAANAFPYPRQFLICLSDICSLASSLSIFSKKAYLPSTSSTFFHENFIVNVSTFHVTCYWSQLLGVFCNAIWHCINLFSLLAGEILCTYIGYFKWWLNCLQSGIAIRPVLIILPWGFSF